MVQCWQNHFILEYLVGAHISPCIYDMFYLWGGILHYSSHAFLNNSLNCRSLGIYFVLAQNIRLVHSFMTGRMNLPVPLAYSTTFGKTILFWNIWWRLTSLHLYIIRFICGMVSYFTPLMPSRTTYRSVDP